MGCCSAIDRSIGSLDSSESEDGDGIVMDMMNVVVARVRFLMVVSEVSEVLTFTC